jgi:REP element-mobilizing transposase RayT
LPEPEAARAKNKMIHFNIRSFDFQKPFNNPSLALFCYENLMQCHKDKKAFITAFCLMPDHLHLCVDMDEKEAKIFVDRWKSFVTHASWKIGWAGRLWQSGALPKESRGQAAENEVIAYVLHNPEKAGLVHLWKEWPYWAEPPYGFQGWRNAGEAVPGLAL